MPAIDPFRTASAMAQAIRAGELSASEALDAQLARIAAVNPKLNAVITLDEDRARSRARELDAARARGEALRTPGVQANQSRSQASSSQRLAGC